MPWQVPGAISPVTEPSNMPRKSRRLPRNRKSAGANSSGNRIAKDEKAKYERRRRRRWGIIKKAKEYHALFDEEVYLLIKDEHKAQYFSTAEGWISSPQQIVGPSRSPFVGRH